MSPPPPLFLRPGPVKLLTDPISAGYLQNPISVYYCYSGSSSGSGSSGGKGAGAKEEAGAAEPKLERCIAEVRACVEAGLRGIQCGAFSDVERPKTGNHEGGGRVPACLPDLCLPVCTAPRLLPSLPRTHGPHR